MSEETETEHNTAYTAVIHGGKYVVGRCDRGESGFTPCQQHGIFMSYDEAGKKADELNEELGIDPKEASLIQASTMWPDMVAVVDRTDYYSDDPECYFIDHTGKYLAFFSLEDAEKAEELAESITGRMIYNGFKPVEDIHIETERLHFAMNVEQTLERLMGPYRPNGE